MAVLKVFTLARHCSLLCVFTTQPKTNVSNVLQCPSHKRITQSQPSVINFSPRVYLMLQCYGLHPHDLASVLLPYISGTTIQLPPRKIVY